VGNHRGILQHGYATGAVEGNSSVGGMVGSASSGSSTQNCYASGQINGTSNVGGIMGRSDDSTLSHCVALNSSITGTIRVGRVVGENSGLLSDNHAFEGIAGRTWNNKGLHAIDGADSSANLLKNDFPLPGVFRVGPWTYQQGSLPGLFGKTVAMPGHIP